MDGPTRLRPWREGDLECVRLAGTDATIASGTTVPAHFTEQAGLAFIHRQWGRLADGEAVSLAIADAISDAAFGLVIVNLRPQRRVAGLGYWVVPPARGRGRATGAVRLMSRWALSFLDLGRLEAWVAVDNRASHRTLSSAGFRREGVLRNFLEAGSVDATVYSLTPDDLVGNGHSATSSMAPPRRRGDRGSWTRHST